MRIALLRPGVSKWLAAGVGAAILVEVTVAHAQLDLTPEINFFGDEIVKELKVVGDSFEVNPSSKKEAEVAGYAHALLFQDGRQLRGELIVLTKHEIVWRRPDVNEPIRFRRDEVRRIALTPAASNDTSEETIISPGQTQPPENKTKSGFATVKFPGGDWLHGELSSTDGQTFALKLNDQTSFTVTRNSMRWLHSGANPAPAFGFEGGTLDLESWFTSGSATRWDIKDGTLTLRDAEWIGRSMAALRRFELSFELPEGGEENTCVWLQPFSPAVNVFTPGTMRLNLGRQEFRYCILTAGFDDEGTPIPKEAADAKGPVRYRVFYDGPNCRLIVTRNGQHIGSWKLEDNNRAQNVEIDRWFQIRGICIQREGDVRNAPLKLNRLRIQPWDGVIPSTDALANEGDCVLSGDGKPRAGKLETLSDKEIVFSGEKLERKSGMFLQFTQTPPPLSHPDAMLLFGQLGEISVADLEIHDGKALCRTVFASTLESSISALQTIAFPKRTVDDPKPSDVLVLKNGDEIPGSLRSAAKGEPWCWRTCSGQELTFQPDYIAGVRLSAGLADTTLPEDVGTFELRNGDRLRGEITGFRGKNIELRHTLLGNLSLEESHLCSLYPNTHFSVSDGGQNPGTWLNANRERPSVPGMTSEVTPDSSRWVYLDGNYILRPQPDTSHVYGLAAPFKQLPERFELRCDVTSGSGGDPRLCISFSGNAGSAQATLGYGRLQVRSFPRENRQQIRRGFFRAPEVSLTDKLPEPTSRRNLRMFVDSKVGTADFLVDGVFIARIGQQAAERLPGLRDSLRLQPYDQDDAPLILSNLWIGPWNGELPKPDNATLAVSLANGDVATGTLTEFHDGKLRIESEAGPLDLPMDKVVSVEFGRTISPQRPEARIRLADGCALSVNAFRWDGENLTAHNEVLGDIQLPARMISELVLTPTPVRTPKIAAPKKSSQKPAADENKAAAVIDDSQKSPSVQL